MGVVVRINFDVAGTAAEFHWDNIAGGTQLRVGDDVVQLQNPFNPGTHVSVGRKRTWRHQVGGHDIEILKVRPLFLAGFRPNAFTVRVDGVVVAEAKGVQLRVASAPSKRFLSVALPPRDA